MCNRTYLLSLSRCVFCVCEQIMKNENMHLNVRARAFVFAIQCMLFVFIMVFWLVCVCVSFFISRHPYPQFPLPARDQKLFLISCLD